LSPKLQVTSEVRAIVNKYLKADPQRADEVKQGVREGNDRLALRLWPHLKLIVMATTGVFESHARLLFASFLKDVFCLGLGHVASEAKVGIIPNGHHNVADGQQYMFCLTNCFFEFIAEEDIEMDAPQTFFLDQVRIKMRHSDRFYISL
jgi:hypothetical protein